MQTKTDTSAPVQKSKDKTSAGDQKEPHNAHRQLLSLARQFGVFPPPAGRGDTSTLSDRAQRREHLQKLRKQQNLENILTIALGFAAEEHPQLKIDPDWFNQFQFLAEDASHAAMQKLWAKILVGEISQPGSFSLKTLALFKTLSVHEAMLFSKVSHLAMKDKASSSMRILIGYYIKPSLFSSFVRQRRGRVQLSEFGVQYSDILTLSNAGILFSDEIESQALKKEQAINFNYNGLPLSLTAHRNDCVINFYKFTQIGMELARLISNEPNLAYLESLKAKFGGHFTLI